jgi:hypothetical protein
MRYTEIKQALEEAEIIDEVSMSPSALQKFANSPEAEGMLMGIEFEMCVPNVAVEDDSGDGEYDYDMDERATDIDDIIRFFREGEMAQLSSSGADRLRSKMWDEYLEWSFDKISNDLDEDDLLSRVRDRLLEEFDINDYIDTAREELGDDASDSDVERKAEELLDAEVDQLMIDADGRDYERAYDDIRQDMEEDLRNSADYDEQAWLSDIGVDWMSNAEREWNLDWPHWTFYGNEDGVDVDTIGDEFAKAMGLESVNTSNNYHGARRDGVRWIIEPDSSIDADSGDGGLEFVSPPMPIKDGIEMIKKFKDWASSIGAYTNKSTGLHMNISVPDMTIENLDYVKLALFLGDEYVLKEFDRQYNSYAKSAMSIVREKIQANPENATALLAKMKEHLNAAASKLVHTGITNKYTSINTKDNYVEFRGPGGDYLKQDLPKLVNTVLRLAQSLRIATDENAYKQEYAKKLYKLVGPKEGEWTDPNNSVALFSRYALGQINKTELVNNVRQAQKARKEKKGEEVQYWVMNNDGTGGKQMVFAASETAAIILGGKQMGMSREQSISKLKAELVNGQAMPAPRSVPEDWIYWSRERLPNMAKDMLDSVRQKMADGGQEYGLRPDAVSWLLSVIDSEIQNRQEQDANAVPETLPQSWKDWVADTLPRVTVEIANSVRQRIRDGGDRLSAPENAWIIRQIDNELRSRMDQGVVDGNETRWKVTVIRGANIAHDPIFVDADTPRQAKLKAAEILSRELGLLTFDLNKLEAVATTQDAGREQLAQDPLSSLSEAWQTWLEQVGTHANETLENMIRTIEAGTGDVVRMTPEQRNLITTTIHQELRSRQTTNYNDLAAAAGGAENAVRDSLPQAHREWLEAVADKSDMDLINVLRNVSTTTVLNDQQTAYFRVIIKRELRRRGISDSERDAGQVNVGQDTVPNYEIYDTETGQVLTQFNADTEEEANRKFYDFEQTFDSDSDYSHQYRVIGARQPANPQAAQQNQLRRDDPVSSNDPESQSPVAQDGSGKWMVGNHTYGRETFRANNRDEAIQAYAERNDISVDELTSDRSFVAKLTDPDQGELDLREMRRLAGLT